MDGITREQLKRWVWFDQLHPIGGMGDDARMADLLRMISNMVAERQNQQPLLHFIDRREAVADAEAADVAAEWGAFIGEYGS